MLSQNMGKIAKICSSYFKNILTKTVNSDIRKYFFKWNNLPSRIKDASSVSLKQRFDEYFFKI